MASPEVADGAAATQRSPPSESDADRSASLFAAAPRTPPAGSRPSRILYIGNLFFEVTTQALEDEFRRIGPVTNARIVTDELGRSKGFGYIEYGTQAEADRAISELNQQVFEGRRMIVSYHVPRTRARTTEPSPPTRTLFVGNMSYQMTDKDLNGKFFSLFCFESTIQWMILADTFMMN